jgi:hypothetical protein
MEAKNVGATYWLTMQLGIAAYFACCLFIAFCDQGFQAEPRFRQSIFC